MSKSNILLASCILALSSTGCSLSIGDMTVVNSSSGSGADAGKAGGGATDGSAGRTSTSGGAVSTAGNASIAGSTVGGGGSAGSTSANPGGTAAGGVNTAGAPPASTAGANTGGTTTGGVSTGGTATGGVATGGATTGGCPGTAGPAMVRLPEGYCIDSTEVTRLQYQAWLNTSPSTAGQSGDCSSNTSYLPDATCMTGANVCQGASCGTHPVICVDWCDAYSYCKAVGKRLCGKIGGGPIGFADYANVVTDQWYNACTAHGLNAYPYGSAFSGMTCNGAEYGLVTTVPVASLTYCTSTAPGYTGTFDLSGNVREWEDACDASGPNGICLQRSGSFGGTGINLSCAQMASSVRTTVKDNIGIRCCSE